MLMKNQCYELFEFASQGRFVSLALIHKLVSCYFTLTHFPSFLKKKSPAKTRLYD